MGSVGIVVVTACDTHKEGSDHAPGVRAKRLGGWDILNQPSRPLREARPSVSHSLTKERQTFAARPSLRPEFGHAGPAPERGSAEEQRSVGVSG